MMIKIIITVEEEAQKAAILSVLETAEEDSDLDFAFGVVTEIQGSEYVEESTGAPDETPTPITGFTDWFDTLPEGTRKQIEDASLFPLMQNAFLVGKRKVRQDNQERMTNIVNQLNTALHLLGELS